MGADAMSGHVLTRVRQTAVALALGALLVVGVNSDSPAAPTPPGVQATRTARATPAVIVIVGDSVAYGAYDTVRGGWVTRLGWTLAASYPHARFRLVNAAGNGGNASLLVAVLRRVRRVRPALVIIAYGLNDFDERVPAATLAAHLRAALRLLHSWPAPPAVVLLGLPPITALSPVRLRAERAYTDTIRRVAREEGAGYLDQFDLWLALGPLLMHRLRHDTEHPNAFGYAFTAAAVAAFLEGGYLDKDGHIRPPRTPPTCAATLCGP
jgi:lysophospholipase L1-like esterase